MGSTVILILDAAAASGCQKILQGGEPVPMRVGLDLFFVSLTSASLLESFRLYAAPFSQSPPLITTRFKEGANPLFTFTLDSDRGLGILLLCASLYKPGGETTAHEMIAKLYERFGNDIFKLNRLPFEKLQKAVEGGEGEDQKRIPAILRSVCDFFYRTGSLNRWLESQKDWEPGVVELSSEIYWMGRYSQLRTKSRYFFLLASFQSGFAEKFPSAAEFQWPVGEEVI